MSTSSTTSIISGATTRFMLLLLPCRGPGGHIATLEIQERQHRRRLLTIEYVYLFHRRENFAHGLQIEATPRHLWAFAVFRQQRVKTRRVALGRVSAVDGIALGLGNGTFGLPTLAGHFLVEGLHGFVDLACLLLLRLVHLVEGAFDFIRRGGHTLHFHRFNAQAGLIQVEELLHFELHLMLNFGAALGEDFGHRVISHYRTHDDLGDIAQRQLWIAIAKEIFDRIDNTILHDPGDLSDIEVTGEHQRLIEERALTITRAHPRLFSAEAKLFFVDAFHFD